MACVSIIAIGNELVRGKLCDTNSSFIARTLYKLGVAKCRIRLSADTLEAISEAVTQEAAAADWIITTGGLGPTSDDATRAAIAAAAGVGLELDEQSLAKLEAYCRRRSRPLNENNRRQAFYPEGSAVVSNPIGTADAFITRIPAVGKSVPLFALPGVPLEMERLVEEALIPKLVSELSDLTPPEVVDLRCFGLAESEIGERIEACGLPGGIEVSYRPQFPEILIQLAAAAGAKGRELLESSRECVRKALGEELVIGGAEPLPEVLSSLLKERGRTLAAAESCSGGLLAHELVSLPGSSEFFLGSVVSYSDHAKEALLGVRAETLTSEGAVSRRTALEMAAGAREKFAADFAVSITGIAGPAGGSAEKPAGTVWIGFSSGKLEAAFHMVLPWERDFIRRYSVFFALDVVRRYVLELPLPPAAGPPPARLAAG